MIDELKARRERASGGYRSIMQFDTDDPEFARGVEVGMIFTMLVRVRPDQYHITCHTTNRTMLERIAQYSGYLLTAVDSATEGWLDAVFVRVVHSGA